MNRTKIDWSDYSWNPVVGCTAGCSKASAGFDCYARRMAARGLWKCDRCKSFWPHLHAERMYEPEKTRRGGIVFAVSMGDLFDPHLPVAATRRVFEAMERPENAHHLFIVLTKQPQNIDGRLGGLGGMAYDPPENVALGVSVTGHLHPDGTGLGELAGDSWRLVGLAENWQGMRVLSAEPLLGPIDLPVYEDGWLDWVIIGADTTPGAAAPEREWVEALIGQAQNIGAPIFLKDNLLAHFPDLNRPESRWRPPLPRTDNLEAGE